MKLFVLLMMLGSFLHADEFTLESDTAKTALTKTEEFNGFGCNGENRSPELHWANAPKESKSFALTLFDPDAPTGHGWWHWIVVNIPPNVTRLPQDASARKLLPDSAVETITDFGKPGFGGPCPPKGDKPHRYIFTIYALDTERLDVTPQTPIATVVDQIKRHAIASASLTTYYGR